MFTYRVGFPGWKIAARLGMPLKVKVSVIYDSEARVFVATCTDFAPYLYINTEAETPEQLQKKLGGMFDDAFFEAFNTYESNRIIPVFNFAIA